MKTTKSGSPYLRLLLLTPCSNVLKIWENKPQFELVRSLSEGALVRLSGDWTQNQYGVEGGAGYSQAHGGGAGGVLGGEPELRARQEAD